MNSEQIKNEMKKFKPSDDYLKKLTKKQIEECKKFLIKNNDWTIPSDRSYRYVDFGTYKINDKEMKAFRVVEEYTAPSELRGKEIKTCNSTYFTDFHVKKACTKRLERKDDGYPDFGWEQDSPIVASKTAESEFKPYGRWVSFLTKTLNKTVAKKYENSYNKFHKLKFIQKLNDIRKDNKELDLDQMIL